MNSTTSASDRAPAPAVPRWLRDERGATAIEYSVVAAGIAVAVAGAIRLLGGNVSALYDSIAAIFG